MRTFTLHLPSSPSDALTVDGIGTQVELDVCLVCQLLWFDQDELARSGIALGAPEAPKAHAADLARAKVELMAETARENQRAAEEADELLELLKFLRSLLRRHFRF